MHVVDLNCDMGESFGSYKKGTDEKIMKYVTSANIACGFHAGDPGIMRKTVQLAIENDTGIGVHPGLQDLLGFGRRNIDISPEEAYELVVYQIGALQAFVTAEGGRLQHVKPHGALYNMAAKNADLAEAVARAVYQVNSDLILFGLAGSELVKAGGKAGLTTASEVFSDRTYQSDGTLTPRWNPNALITDQKAAVNQVIRMVKEKKVQSTEGQEIPIQAETICIHGDGAHALEFARYIRESLEQADIQVRKIKECK